MSSFAWKWKLKSKTNTSVKCEGLPMSKCGCVISGGTTTQRFVASLKFWEFSHLTCSIIFGGSQSWINWPSMQLLQCTFGCKSIVVRRSLGAAKRRRGFSEFCHQFSPFQEGIYVGYRSYLEVLSQYWLLLQMNIYFRKGEKHRQKSLDNGQAKWIPLQWIPLQGWIYPRIVFHTRKEIC